MSTSSPSQFWPATGLEESDETRNGMPQSTRNRHSAAEEVFKHVYHENSVLFLRCALSLSVTSIVGLKKPLRSFLASLQGLETPDGFRRLADSLVSSNYKTFLHAGFMSKGTAPGRIPSLPTERAMLLDGVNIDPQRRGSHHINQAGASAQQNRVGDSLEIHHNVQVSDDNQATSIGNRSSQNEDMDEDSPMFTSFLKGTAYKLQPLDVVRVLLEKRTVDELEIVLTMPHTEGAKPFITMHCPDQLALNFLTKRDPLPW